MVLRPRGIALGFAAGLVVVLAISGCAEGDHAAASGRSQSSSSSKASAPAATPTAAAPAATQSPIATAATVTAASVQIFDRPDGSPEAELANPQQSGAPLTFLVDDAAGAWLRVDLAQRPNGSTGWVRATDVTLHSLEYSLAASTEDNTLSLSRDGVLIKTYSAATGTGSTPTPHGSFYITELLAPTNSGYGPYAFGLSAFSDVLNSFGGGPGQIGLHGTDDSGSIGHAASHGCIRLSNTDITELASMLPLGTPITIN